MFKLSLWLNLAAFACVAWGDVRGYQAHQRIVNLAHDQMRGRFEQCAARVRAEFPHETNRLTLVTMSCAESLDDSRWVSVLAPHLWRDTAIAGAGPTALALALILLGLLTPRLRAARAPMPGKASR